MGRSVLLIAVVALAMLAIGVPGAAAAGLSLTLVKAGFDSPVYVTNAGDARLFVVEQSGRIKIVKSDGSVATFVDLSGVVSQDGGERGLLGLAFHPNYASNGLFYVTYTRASDEDDVVAEYHVTANPDVADPSSGRVLIALDDPYSNHNAGWLAFKGQYLYITEGDGGSGGDPQNRAQNKNSYFGKILRINPLDPDGPSGPLAYSIPSDNPFVGRRGLDEIWSYGLRNPWRCSFDDVTGKLWCGDVGQDRYEEIDRVKTGRGVNFGWRKVEGRHYYNWPGHASGALCTGSCLKRPIAEYGHDAFGGGNCAVTGGYVDRRAGASLNGMYVFGDYCSGRLWAIPATWTPGTALPAPAADTGFNISSFGAGADGRLYVVDLGGAVYRIDQS